MMKYYVCQHIYKNKIDVQIFNENELAEIGFTQLEVKQRGGSFIIEYQSCTLAVRQCKNEDEAKKILDSLRLISNHNFTKKVTKW